jgi:hypothetical protein
MKAFSQDSLGPEGGKNEQRAAVEPLRKNMKPRPF